MQNDFDKDQYLMIIHFLQIEYPISIKEHPSNKEYKKWQSIDLFLSFPFGLGYWQICQSLVIYKATFLKKVTL